MVSCLLTKGPVRTDWKMPKEPKHYSLDKYTISEVVRRVLRDQGITDYEAAFWLKGLEITAPSTMQRFLNDSRDTLCSRVEDILAACGIALVRTKKSP